MGLDMYLRSMPKKDYDREAEQARRLDDADEEICRLYDEVYKPRLADAPRDEFGGYDLKAFGAEHERIRNEYLGEKRKLYEKHGVELDEDGHPACRGYESNRLGYWRKHWPLHGYIANKYGVPGDDNCVDIVLDEDACRDIIRSCSKGGEVYDELPTADGDDVYYTADESAKQVTRAFNDAISRIKAGDVVYYYAWY